MREILGNAKTVRELLKGKYSIDYYQREFKWQDKQIRELIDDLSNKFLEDYQPGHPREKVSDYGHYFLGSIIISRKDNANYIIDGQQRLTSLTLLLIYLRNLQKDTSDPPIEDLIVSSQYGKKSFNLHVEERIPCMEALHNQKPIHENGQPESVQNIVARYRDIESCFPEELSGDALPYFIDWLIENVHLVEITAYSDDDDVVQLKLRLVARFVDILLTRRVWNFRSIVYSNMQYATFVYMRDIRGLEPQELAEKLLKLLNNQEERISNAERFYLNMWSRKPIHRILARMTDYVEQQSGMPSRYMEYVSESGRNRYEVEHIWANKPDRHKDEFPHPSDFEDYRNRIGGLLLLPKTFNDSYGALPYEEKLPHYYAQNLLARSLHPQCYDHNPGFMQFIERSHLPFHPYDHLRKADLDERGALYRQIAELIWNPAELIRDVDL